VVLLLLVVAGLPVATYADALDPTWTGGLWEDDDFDYVILLVTNLKAALVVIEPVFTPTENVVRLDAPAPIVAPVLDDLAPFYRRGPPLA
jgi:hypothetical protein